MKEKNRPMSSKVVSNIPIYIDEEDTDSFCNLQPVSLTRSHTKPTLNTMMPDLPQFPIHSKSTALLYSQFIVKGLKNDKISTVRNAIKKK